MEKPEFNNIEQNEEQSVEQESKPMTKEQFFGGPEKITKEDEETKEDKKYKEKLNNHISSFDKGGGLTYYLGNNNGRSFFVIECTQEFYNSLSEDEQTKFKIEDDKYIFADGQVPEVWREEKSDNSERKYHIREPRDFKKKMYKELFTDDSNKQVVADALRTGSDKNLQAISQAVEEIFNSSEDARSNIIEKYFSEQEIEDMDKELSKDRMPKPEKIEEENIKNLVELIKNKKVLFYTGAGMSASAPNKRDRAWGMGQLLEKAKIDMNKKGRDAFFDEAIKDPSEMVNIQQENIDTLHNSPATPAHKALKNIAMLKKSRIFTENHDTFQEKTEIKPDKISGPWLEDNVKPEWLRDVDAVITIGLSVDDRGFLAWYKENNPNGQIVAINQEQAKYLGDEDIWVSGDLQKIVTELEKKLAKDLE